MDEKRILIVEDELAIAEVLKYNRPACQLDYGTDGSKSCPAS